MVMEFEARPTVFILLPSGEMLGPKGWAIDREGHLFKILDHVPEAYRMVQMGFELASMAEDCEDPAAKMVLLQSAEKIVQSGRRMVQRMVEGIAEGAYSGA